MRYLKIILGVLVIIIGVIFVLQNKDLQRPIELGFDPLYMFKSQEAAIPLPAPVAQTEVPAGGGEKPATGEEAGSGPFTEPASPDSPKPPAETAPAQATAQEIPSGIPAFILIFIAFFVGILVASLFGIMEKFRLKKVVKQGVARIRELEDELKKLRNLPLTQPTTQPILAPPPALAEPQEEVDQTAGPEDEETKEEG